MYGVIGLRDVFRARSMISRYLPRTPLIHSRRISEALGCSVYLKLENLQPTKAFKVRGGVYFAMLRKEEAVRRGLIAASTGNHGQSIAFAGKLIGADVIIVMPKNVPEVKVKAVRDLGADVIFHGDVYEQASEFAERLARERGHLFVHGVNEPTLYAGVATMHLENLEDLPDVNVIINPIGGGSGAVGAVTVAKAADPSIEVIGVQAEGAQSFYLSWKRGELVSTGRADTIAEGLATSRAYELPFSILREKLDDVVLVSDDEIRLAMRMLLEMEGQVAEPSGAAALAAAIKIRERLAGKKVIAMVTGGNVDPELVRKLFEHKSSSIKLKL
ncbi:MAG: threonine/serine dehydratase [Candidatus Korarchaeum sp.]